MRLLARDSVSGETVKVTLRNKEQVDLTNLDAEYSGYTHIGRMTISGRLKFGKGKYHFERV